MAYDENSFLQGLAVGKSLKGWTSGLGTSVPTCWNDEGKYTYFYIDYHLPISAVSITMFNLSTRVLCEAGELDVSAIESVNSTTFKVYCDISKAANGWVAVTGYNSSWLYYDTGYPVPEYSSIFWLDGKQTYTPGYMEDEGALRGRYYNGEDSYTAYTVAQTLYEYEDETTLFSKEFEVEETLTISYS